MRIFRRSLTAARFSPLILDEIIISTDILFARNLFEDIIKSRKNNDKLERKKKREREGVVQRNIQDV
jgi:hypothetical protein